MGITTANAPKKPGRSVWDHDSDISLEQITALCTNLEDIAADIFWNVHRDEALDTENTVRVVSDASGSKGAFMSFDEFDRTAKQDCWSFSEEFMTTSFLLKELMAATVAIERCYMSGRPLHLAVDNSAVFFVLKRGLSTNSADNEFLTRIFKTIPMAFLKVSLLHSADNAADP